MLNLTFFSLYKNFKIKVAVSQYFYYTDYSSALIRFVPSQPDHRFCLFFLSWLVILANFAASTSESSLSGCIEIGDSTTRPFRSKPDLSVLTEFFDEMQDQVLLRFRSINQQEQWLNKFLQAWLVLFIIWNILSSGFYILITWDRVKLTFCYFSRPTYCFSSRKILYIS